MAEGFPRQALPKSFSLSRFPARDLGGCLATRIHFWASVQCEVTVGTPWDCHLTICWHMKNSWLLGNECPDVSRDQDLTSLCLVVALWLFMTSTGWWFGTFFLFRFSWESSPQLAFIFLRQIGIPWYTTNQSNTMPVKAAFQGGTEKTWRGHDLAKNGSLFVHSSPWISPRDGSIAYDCHYHQFILIMFYNVL